MASPSVNGVKIACSTWLQGCSSRSPNVAKTLHSMRSPNSARPLHVIGSPTIQTVLPEPLQSVGSLHTTQLKQRPLQESDGSQRFDESMLQYIVCPLSKQPLRYDKERNELVSEAIGVAYPVINGIPNLVPQDGRQLHQETKTSQTDKDT